LILVIPVAGSKGGLIFVTYFNPDIVKSYRKVEFRVLLGFSNPFSHFRNKW